MKRKAFKKEIASLALLLAVPVPIGGPVRSREDAFVDPACKLVAQCRKALNASEFHIFVRQEEAFRDLLRGIRDSITDYLEPSPDEPLETD